MSAKTPVCTAIILAAGGSSRMGRPKALLRLGGQTLLERAVEAARAAGASPLIVLGADAERIRLHAADARVLVNPDWSQGMGTSIAWAMAALDPNTECVLVVAVDQPAVDAELLRQLIEACGVCAPGESVDVAATRYANDVVGVPACFGRSLFGALRSLDGDRGARGLLRSGEHRVAEVNTGGKGADVDTPEQWRAFVEQYEDGGRS
jgi:molybdenum cofactor cytidylyltransferase